MTNAPAKLDVVILVLVARMVVLAPVSRSNTMGMWSSRHGKFLKKDPNHGSLGKRIRNWICRVGLCNIDSCSNKEYHKRPDIPNNCCNKDCGCHKKKSS